MQRDNKISFRFDMGKYHYWMSFAQDVNVEENDNLMSLDNIVMVIHYDMYHNTL